MKRIKLQKNGNVADGDLTVLRAHFAAGGQFTIEMSVVSCTEETRATKHVMNTHIAACAPCGVVPRFAHH